MIRIGIPWFVTATLVCACADVPTLKFVQPDAASDTAGDDSGDAGPGTCTQPNDAAPFPYVCCGALACEGQCTGTACDLCTTKCGADPGVFCCAKMNNVVCLPLTMVCHS